MYRIKYSTETGYDDGGYWENWDVTNDKRNFRADNKEDAEWLCALLNKEG